LLPVFPTLPRGTDLPRWEVLAEEVRNLHLELCRGGLRFEDVAALFRRGEMPFDDAERWIALAAAQARYETLLRDEERADLELEVLTTATADRVLFDLPLWLVGVVEIPESHLRLIRRLQSPPNVVVHAPEAEAGGFDELGTLIAPWWLDRESPVEDEHIVIADRPSDQAAAVAAELSMLGDAFSVEDVAVAVPDPGLVPFLERTLGSEDLRTRVAAGAPLSGTRPFRLLAAIADYLDRPEWSTFAALARHPDLGLDRLAPLDRLDRHHRDHLPSRLDRSLPVPDDASRNSLDRAREALDGPRLLGTLSGCEALSEWPRRIMAVLVECYGATSLSRDDPSDRRLLIALQKIRSAAGNLQSLPPVADEQCHPSAAIRLLLEEVRSEVVVDEPGDMAIELLPWREMRLEDAPVAVVTGFNEPFLPRSAGADQFLPDRLRQRLGLVDNTRAYARDAYELTALDPLSEGYATHRRAARRRRKPAAPKPPHAQLPWRGVGTTDPPIHGIRARISGGRTRSHRRIIDAGLSPSTRARDYDRATLADSCHGSLPAAHGPIRIRSESRAGP
jgi:ATP-dependent helicase/nuclease subunit B